MKSHYLLPWDSIYPGCSPKAVFGAIVLPLRKELMAFMTNDPDAGRNDAINATVAANTKWRPG
jgi:hypothetical protein